MTREEAIKAIQDFIGWFREDSLIRKALEMAIKALSQEPCEDAISRELAIKACMGMRRYTGIDETPYEYAENIIAELPSVTVRQTKSHKEKVTHHKCKECRWLANEKTVIGRKCVNPHKVWKSRTAMWHQPSCKACKMFKPYKEEPQESEDKE